MSTRRTSKAAGWVDQKKLPKGPNGRALCRQCNEEVPKGRRTFCSQECVDRWSIKTNPSYARQLVFARDKGVCALCGLDCNRLYHELRRLDWRARRDRLRELGIPEHRTSYWDADHIVPVVEGGGECDLDNYRTLCIPCHQEATRALAARRAQARQPQVIERRRSKAEQERLARTGQPRLL